MNATVLVTRITRNLWKFRISEFRTTKDSNGFSSGGKTIKIMTIFVDGMGDIISHIDYTKSRSIVIDQARGYLQAIAYRHKTDSQYWDEIVPITEENLDICKII
jgi:hypothetical protein